MSLSEELDGTCRRCGADIKLTVTEDHVANGFADCKRCGYLTILRADPEEVPLREALAEFFDDHEVDELLDPNKDVVATLPKTLTACANKIIDLVGQNRDVAIFGFLKILNDFQGSLAKIFEMSDPLERTVKGPLSLDSTIAQITYCAIALTGPPSFPLRQIPEPEVTAQFGRKIFPLISDLAFLGNVFWPRINDGSMRIESHGKKILVHKTEIYSLLMESGVNSLRQENDEAPPTPESPGGGVDIDSIYAPELRHAIELSAGIDLKTFLVLMTDDFGVFFRHGAARRQGKIVIIKSHSLQPAARLQFDKLTLSIEKLQRFETPGLFDTGRVHESKPSPEDILLNAAKMNWMAYYGCFKFFLKPGGPPMYLTSQRQIQGTLMTVSQRASHLLSALEMQFANANSDPKALQAFRADRRAIHANLENKAADLALQAGWTAISGLEHGTDGKPLPCGEIDLLATSLQGGVRLILIAEVKDSDTPMVLPGALDQIGRLIDKAETQLQRKGHYVAQSWGAALHLVGVEEDPPDTRCVLGRLVLTRRAVGAPLYKHFAGCTVDGFAQVVRDLATPGHAIWESPWRIHLTDVQT